MYVDALTIAAVADEFRETLVGGRVQRVVLAAPLTLGLEVYAGRRRWNLIASAHPQFARVHLVGRKISRGVEQATPLLLLLRKYLVGGQILAVEQPPLERILVLSIVKERRSRNQADEEPPESEQDGDESLEPPEPDLPLGEVLRSELIIEPQDRRSNIILVDDNNIILESIKRVTPRMSRRVVLPRQPYEWPPPPNKRDPGHATAAGLAALVEKGGELGRALVGAYRGVSPQVAREVLFRALGTPEATLSADLPFYTIAARLRELFSAPWAPSLSFDDEGQPRAFAAYELSHLEPSQPAEGISAALEAFYAAREAVVGHGQRRSQVAEAIGQGLDRLRHRRSQLAGELERAGELEQLRWEGEMIFAFLHSLQPGQTALEVEGRTIALSLRPSFVEQAQARFRQYEKARSAVEGVPARLTVVEGEIRAAEELLALLHLSEDHDQIEEIARDAQAQGLIRPDPSASHKPRAGRPIRPLHLRSSDGLEIVVGRSARQNEEVTFKIGRTDDTWFHVRHIHGSHVIVRNGGRPLAEQTIQEAAAIAAFFSQAREESAVEVDLCRRSQVRKIAGGPVGLVSYHAEQTVRIAPLNPSDLRPQAEELP